MSETAPVTYSTIDANEAVASVAYRFSEVVAIYPITPSSPMGESAEAWSAVNRENLWHTVPSVVELQSEGGAAGAVHGALQTGALATTFTASQGLLLMIPNMYKIAGEFSPCVFHVAARALAAQGLSIFGDHSDVMSVRSCGWAMLCGSSTQEAADFAVVAHAATLESRVPFVNFFDGFRTSHEVGKIANITDDTLNAMIDQKWVADFHQRGLTSDAPVIRGTAQNPDVYFQGREVGNQFYVKVPGIVQNAMNKFAALTGRSYNLVDYVGAEDATDVMILMGSGCEATHETVEDMIAREGGKVGVLKVRLYRPFPGEELVKELPTTVRKIAVLDRTKEPGSPGEPLYLDVVHALFEAQADGRLHFQGGMPVVLAGRYGLGSKEFTPAMIRGVYHNLASATPKNHFAVGVDDDVLGTSIPYDSDYTTAADDVTRAMFFGLGSDGTIGANKDSIKIIGQNTDLYVQGYFVYDSKKSGSTTVSHLRFGPRPIHSTYLITHANFLALHQPTLLNLFDFLKFATTGATFLMNSPHPADKVWDTLPARMQQQIIDKKIKLHVIDAFSVAKKTGMGGRINTIMQTCFFALSNVLPADEAIAYIKKAIAKTYAKKGEEVINKNIAAVNATLENLHEVNLAGVKVNGHAIPPIMSADAPEYVSDVLGKIMSADGDSLPVSCMPVDGTFPSGTSQYEKRNLALEIPVWDPEICIQCGKCTAVCPHAAIRSKVFDIEDTKNAPASFKSADARHPDWKGRKFVIQVSADDCTGCTLCTDVCPAKNKKDPTRKAINMEVSAGAVHDMEAANWDFFMTLPDMDRALVKTDNIRSMQVLRPLFEFSGACAGCGETPYIKMLTQLFGNRLVVANATGCSSIYGGNLPTTPWSKDDKGRGPAWANSLFEDNAEFGLGFRVSLDKQQDIATEMIHKYAEIIGTELVDRILANPQKNEADIQEQRDLVAQLKAKIADKPECARLLASADKLVRKSVWILGGDGWAYDIGYGGLDHVLASGKNVKVLVMDTEVYSNTGGQCSKATPRAAVAKFATRGKDQVKKDLGLMAMTYGNIYVASVALGAKDEHTLKAFVEAEAYDGPALIIAYSHCISHGIDMAKGLQQQKIAVDSGRLLLYRYNPDLVAQGKNPLILEGKGPKSNLRDALLSENRFRLLAKNNKDGFESLLDLAQKDVDRRWSFYRSLSELGKDEETK
ncbi:MAG: pyruvate:ferredoxin (flavodoxin) oxidoreductase [Akkermansia sp.]